MFNDSVWMKTSVGVNKLNLQNFIYFNIPLQYLLHNFQAYENFTIYFIKETL